jgi:hypothetical protein
MAATYGAASLEHEGFERLLVAELVAHRLHMPERY